MDVIINNPPAAQPYAQVQGNPYGYGPMYGYPQHHGPGALLPLLLILGAVFFAKRRRMMRRFMMAGGSGPLGHHDHSTLHEKFRQGRDRFVNDSALHIARERYARGEINADEYEALRRNLSGEGQPQSASYAKPKDDGDLKL